MIRIFAAIPLPEALRMRIDMLAQLLPLPRREPAENLHLTLAFMGEVTEPAAEQIHLALERIAQARFPLALRGVGLFGGDRPRLVYVGTRPEPALDRLHANVLSAVRRAGATVEAHRFVPHVTLARLKPFEVDPARLERALIESAAFAAEPFMVDHFGLYRSHIGRRGAHYTELALYPLD